MHIQAHGSDKLTIPWNNLTLQLTTHEARSLLSGVNLVLLDPPAGGWETRKLQVSWLENTHFFTYNEAVSLRNELKRYVDLEPIPPIRSRQVEEYVSRDDFRDICRKSERPISPGMISACWCNLYTESLNVKGFRIWCLRCGCHVPECKTGQSKRSNHFGRNNASSFELHKDDLRRNINAYLRSPTKSISHNARRAIRELAESL
jgi:hypothetical protein